MRPLNDGDDSVAPPAHGPERQGMATRLESLLAHKGHAAPAVAPARNLRDPERFAGLRLSAEPATVTALAPHPVASQSRPPLTLRQLAIRPVPVRVPVTVRLPGEDYRQLKTLARERGTTMQAIASAAVRERLEAEDAVVAARRVC